nr:glycosyltransferase family 2 protein [uncultured Sellimonas sp.]
MKVLIIIPAYNEEENILKVVEGLKKTVPQCDYIVINDCSKDRTKKILEENGIPHINLIVNLGLTGAVQTGYKYAWYHGYDAALQFDGDGQHLPEHIPDLIREIENGYDIVIGSRFVREKKPMSLRMLGSRVITWMIRLTTGKRVTDPTSGMRMINRELIRDYAFEINRKPEPDTLAYQMKRGYRVKEIQVTMQERTAGTSIYSGIGNSIKYMVKVIVTLLFFN